MKTIKTVNKLQNYTHSLLMWYRLYCACSGGTESLMVQLVLIELSATNARTEPAGLAYILTNFSPSSGMVGMVMIIM